MLKLLTEEKEFYNEATNAFLNIPSKMYKFEHSLISISEWESITCRPFLSSKKTDKEMMLYFECMCLDEDFSSLYLSDSNIKTLLSYIENTHTATTIKSESKSQEHKTVTSEVIYAMMADMSVPFTCETWNLNRLLMLLNVISARRNPKKMSRQEIYKQNQELNKKRREQLGSKG